MNLSTTLLLGFIAGVTIVLGLPVGRMRRPAPTLRVFLNATAIGVLLFLFWDVLAAAWEPVDSALADRHAGTGGIAPILGYGLLFAGGLSVGLLGLVAYERFMARSVRDAVNGHRSARPGGPGAMSVAEAPARVRSIGQWSPARRLALLIAVGIGLHNFAEGLAIGQAAASSEIALATVLVVGFALHNATEGFGIVAPLAAEANAAEANAAEANAAEAETGVDRIDARPSWRFLLGLAAIGGGPTFIGTAVGHSFTSEPVSVIFLTLAAGSIVYVVAQLFGVAAKAKRPDLVAYGLLIGLLAGFITDAIVTLGGA